MMKADPVYTLRVALEEAAVMFGILAATYREAKDGGMADLMTAARNKATAALERAGFPYQEDPPPTEEGTAR